MKKASAQAEALERFILSGLVQKQIKTEQSSIAP